jgi:hypothetical protein
MDSTGRWISLAVAAILAVACASPNHVRPNRELDSEDFDLRCEGDFDQAPVLLAGKSPVFPIGMLNPDVIEDRKIRHLPMEWSVTTTFTVGADGRAAEVRATPTSPPSFSNHMVVAIKSWRFAPATRDGNAVASRCKTLFGYHLH